MGNAKPWEDAAEMIVPLDLTARTRRISFAEFNVEVPNRGDFIYGQINSAVRIKPGDLLFNVLPGNVCYHYSQETKAFTYVFELHWGPGTFLWNVVPDGAGNIYCTMSGIRTPAPIVDAAFGNWGGVAVVNPRQHSLRTIAERGRIVDPYSIQLMPSGKLLIADFQGFEPGGIIYCVDPATGSLESILETDLQEPTSCFVDDNHTLWVANGDQMKQDGEILQFSLDSKQKSIIYKRQGDFTGALLGVFPSHSDEFLIAVRNEWANRVNSSVLLIEKATGKAHKLLTASEDEPMFFSTLGAVAGNTLWIAECCNRQLIEYDLSSQKIMNRIDMTNLMGGHRGMRSSFDGISGIHVVP